MAGIVYGKGGRQSIYIHIIHLNPDPILSQTTSHKQLHYGFYDSFRLLSHGTTLEEDWRALVRNRTCDASVALITGHSLGGAFVTFAKILGCMWTSD